MMRYRRHPDLKLTRLENEGVALHLGERKYFTLNETGATLVESLAQPRDEHELVRILCEEFDVTPEVAHPTVLRFLDECIGAHLVLRDS